MSAQAARVRITHYHLKGRTASGIPTREGICAVSRDLERKGFSLGKRVRLKGYGTYLIADRTGRRIKNTIDIWVSRKGGVTDGRNIKAEILRH